MIEVNDHGSIRRTAADFRELGNKYPDELNKALEKTADKLKEDIAKSAASILPKRGGLASAISHIDISIVKHGNGVSIVANAKYNLEEIDRGTVRHPVYGNRRTVVTQQVNPGFWSKPTKDSERDFGQSAEKALDELVARVER